MHLLHFYLQFFDKNNYLVYVLVMSILFRALAVSNMCKMHAF